ncbi:MAG: SEC-C metal-binding domain-containing protein [Longimicrobiales bacterium]
MFGNGSLYPSNPRNPLIGLFFPRNLPQSAKWGREMGKHAGRNEPCPCGSGKKYKKCCATKQQQARTSKLLIGVVIAALAGAVYAGFVGFDEDSAAVAGAGRVWSPEHGHYH